LHISMNEAIHGKTKCMETTAAGRTLATSVSTAMFKFQRQQLCYEDKYMISTLHSAYYRMSILHNWVAHIHVCSQVPFQ